MIRHPTKPIAGMSDAEWERAFPDEESCVEWLVNARWPQEVRCPACGSDMVFPASLQEYRWRCFGCKPDLGHAFDYRSGLVFQNSAAPLRIWLKALHQELRGRGPTFNYTEAACRSALRKAMRGNDFNRILAEPARVPVSAPETEPESIKPKMKI